MRIIVAILAAAEAEGEWGLSLGQSLLSLGLSLWLLTVEGGGGVGKEMFPLVLLFCGCHRI